MSRRFVKLLVTRDDQQCMYTVGVDGYVRVGKSRRPFEQQVLLDRTVPYNGRPIILRYTETPNHTLIYVNDKGVASLEKASWCNLVHTRRATHLTRRATHVYSRRNGAYTRSNLS